MDSRHRGTVLPGLAATDLVAGQETLADCSGRSCDSGSRGSIAKSTSAFILATHLDGLVLGGWLAGLLADRDRPAGYWRRFGIRLRVVGVGSTALYLAATTFPRVLSTTWPGLDLSAMVYIFRPLFLSLAFFALVGTIVLHAGHPVCASFAINAWSTWDRSAMGSTSIIILYLKFVNIIRTIITWETRCLWISPSWL